MKEDILTIYICDSDKNYREKEEKVCCELLKGAVDKYSVIIEESGKSVLEYDEEIDILILDINMPDIDGIQIKKYMERRNKDTYIVFVANNKERILEAFGINVYAFLEKKDIDDLFKNTLLEIIERKKRNYLLENKYKIYDILYVKSEQGYSVIHFRKGDIRIIRKNLKELVDELSNADFVRTHRSYIVNMNEIKGAITDKVLVGHTEIPVSVRMRTKVKEIYQEFCRVRNKR